MKRVFVEIIRIRQVPLYTGNTNVMSITYEHKTIKVIRIRTLIKLTYVTILRLLLKPAFYIPDGIPNDPVNLRDFNS